MTAFSINELELLTFFECEPSLRYESEPWEYNDALYLISQNNNELSFAIDPANKDVRITLKSNSQILYELNAMDVRDVKYFKHNNNELLTLDLNNGDKLTLRLRPEISIKHTTAAVE